MMNIAMILTELTLAVYFSISEGCRLLMSMDYSVRNLWQAHNHAKTGYYAAYPARRG